MPEFTYVGEDGRTYPSIGLEVEPGAVYELSEAPDHRFVQSEPDVKPKPKKNEQE